MNRLNTYVELPYIGTEELDNVHSSAFGYVDIHDNDINQYLLARQFRDNCGDDCACDFDYFNPAFLMKSGQFNEQLESKSSVLSESLQMFQDLASIEAQIEAIQSSDSHHGNDLAIYQIQQDKHTDGFVSINLIKIIKKSLQPEQTL